MTDPCPLPAGRQAGKRMTCCCLAGLALLTCAIASRDIGAGGLSWSDAPLHVMDGVFLHDLLSERPEGSWQEWAEQYYLHHPCLGIVVYYPPLFAAVEAVVFRVAGVSATAARVTVLLFVLATVWLLFLLGRDLFGTLAGFVGAAIAVITPAGVAWSRQVMLEWPATFWIVLALLAYVRFIDHPRRRWGILMTLGCAGAYLTKQTAAFVLPVILAHAGLLHRRQLLRQAEFLVPPAIAAAMIFAYARATAGTNALAPQLVAGTPPWHHLLTVEHWTWYLVRTPAIIGWPAIIAGATLCFGCLYWRSPTVCVHTRDGSPEAVVRPVWHARLACVLPAETSPQDSTHHARIPKHSGLVLLVLWAAGWWLISTILAAKEERYLFFAVPAIALLIGAGLQSLLRQVGRSSAALLPAALSSLVLLVAAGQALTASALRLADMQPTVAFLHAQSDADLVLVDSVRDGQFVFDNRIFTAMERSDAEAPAGPRREIIPLRASKLLYSRAARTRYNYAQHVHAPGDIIKLIEQFGIRYVVLEDQLPTSGKPGAPPADEDRSWDTPPRLMLRKLVSDESLFEPVFAQPMACQDPTWENVRLLTYRYRKPLEPTEDTVSIPVPAMGKEVELRLRRGHR